MLKKSVIFFVFIFSIVFLSGCEENKCENVNCDDDDPCTIDFCESDTGSCINKPKICLTGDSCNQVTGKCELISNLVESPTSEDSPIQKTVETETIKVGDNKIKRIKTCIFENSEEIEWCQVNSKAYSGNCSGKGSCQFEVVFSPGFIPLYWNSSCKYLKGSESTSTVSITRFECSQ